MPNCPFCPDNTFFMTENELGAHILTDHPEKTRSAEAYAKAMERIFTAAVFLYATAQELTRTSLGSKGAPIDTVWSTFTEFVDRLVRLRSREE